jgi:shikimate kinase
VTRQNDSQVMSRPGPVLVGMRGSGKSHLAPLVAEFLGMDWVDADQELVNRHGLAIADMFRRHGQNWFRQAERELVLEMLTWTGRVLALGGGAVLDARVRRELHRRVTVWLVAPVPVLARRISGSDRPSLTGEPIEQELAAVLAERKALYQDVAALEIATEINSPIEAARLIAGQYRAFQAGGND